MSQLRKYIIDHLPFMVFVFDTDERFTEIYSEFKESFLYVPKKDFIGKYHGDVLPSDLSQQISHSIQRIEAGEESITFEYQLQVEGEPGWYSAMLKKFDIKGAGEAGYLGFVRDITDKARIETALKISEEKYRNIFENSIDVIYQTDMDGVVLDITPSIELFSGYKREEIIGDYAINYYYYPEDRARLVKTLSENREARDFEVRLKTRQGHLVYVSLNAYLTFDPEGKPSGTEGHMRDITGRKEAEEALKKANMQLQELNNQKDKLFSVIAHDLRNPIAGLVSMFEVMFDQFETMKNEELLYYLGLLRISVGRTQELLEDLLLWSKSQFNRLDLNLEAVNFEELVDRTFEQLESQALDKRIILEKKISGSPDIESDPHLLSTILRNLIANAIKFSDNESAVTVDIKQDEREFLVAVIDRGVGIKDADQEKILNKTKNFTTWGTAGEKGSGLGLDLCRDLVDKLKGKIWFESEYGKGSTFFFSIPMKGIAGTADSV